MAYNIKISVSCFYQFCKKNREKDAIDFSQFIMDGDGKILPMHLRLGLLKIIGVSSKWKSMKEIGVLKPEVI